MLVCVSCNIEFKEDRKSCTYCGGSLTTKEDVAPKKKGSEKEEEKTEQKLVCPNCKMIYEFGKSCIQCGADLISEIPAEKKEESTPPQGKQVRNPDEGRTCPACKISYPGGNFCPRCGSSLFPKELSEALEGAKTTSKPEFTQEAVPVQIKKNHSEIPRKNLICPHCKIIYERGSSCVRCGSSLVTEGQESETSETRAIPEDLDPSLPNIKSNPAQTSEKQITPPSSLKTRESEALQQATERMGGEELELFSDRETEPPSGRTKEAAVAKPTEIPEKRSFRPKKSSINYRRMFLELGSVSIMVLAGGYLLWSIYSHVTKLPEPKSSHSEQVSAPGRSDPSNPFNVTAQVPVPKKMEKEDAVRSSAMPKEAATENSSPSSSISSDGLSSDKLETAKIKDLLEQIRQANLDKDIDLFMSCYASEFKDRDGKKKATLSFWKQFDYLELSYDLKKSAVTGDTARVKIEWTMKISAKTGGPAQESKTFLDALLRKEDTSWKIQEVKQTS